MSASEFMSTKNVHARDSTVIDKIKSVLDRLECFTEEAKAAFEQQLQIKYDASSSNKKNKSHQNNNNKHHHQTSRKNFERKKESLVALMNKLNESNYSKIYGKVSSSQDFENLTTIVTIMKKVDVETGYVKLYVRLLIDLIKDGKISVKVLVQQVDQKLLETKEFVESYDASERLVCDYDDFCQGNLLAKKAEGINAFVMSIFEIGSSDVFKESWSTPLDYFRLFLIKLPINEVSAKLIQDYFGRFRSAPACHLLEKLFLWSRDKISNKTRFAIEECIRPKKSTRNL